MHKRNCVWHAFASLAFAGAAAQLCGQSLYTPYAFTNFAGSPAFGGSGTNDGTGSLARFENASGIAADTNGNLYVTDTTAFTIRKITPDAVVTTLAGCPKISGTNDGVGCEARFGIILGLAVDSAGNILVADSSPNNTIRKITPAGVVTTLAGKPGEAGKLNGTGGQARFDNPYAVAVDAADNVFVADRNNSRIRKITPDGVVTTLKDGTGNELEFDKDPQGIAVDSATNIYVIEANPPQIRKITPSGALIMIAGSGHRGTNDGIGTAATFGGPNLLTLDSGGNLYVADTGSHTIRKITPAGLVTTLAGRAGQPGTNDGIACAARFNFPIGVAVDPRGSVYIADTSNSRVTKGTPAEVQFETSSPSVFNDNFLVGLSGPFDTNVVVEASANFQAWTPVQTNAVPPCGTSLSLPVGTNQYQFFRARLSP